MASHTISRETHTTTSPHPSRHRSTAQRRVNERGITAPQSMPADLQTLDGRPAAQCEASARTSHLLATPSRPLPLSLPLPLLLPLALALSLCALPRAWGYRGVRVSDQGAGFCTNLVQGLSFCPSVSLANELKIGLFQGKWYTIGSSAQNAFSIFGDQGGQCGTEQFNLVGRVRGRNVLKVVRSGTVLGNPIRNVETISMSQQAQTIGLGARFLCQFLVGQEPLSTVVPQLKQVSSASSRVGKIASMRQGLLSQYTAAVRAVVRNDPTLSKLVSSTENQPQFSKFQNTVSTHANLTSPAILGSLNLLESYASISSTALDTTVTVKGLSNAISLGNIFSSMQAKAKGKIGTLAATVVAGVNAISMYTEQVFTALSRTQWHNMVIARGDYPSAQVSSTSAKAMMQQMVAVGWLTRRMQGSRRSINRAAYKLLLKFNGTDATMSQASQAILALSQDKGPMTAAIQQMARAAGEIHRTLSLLSPGFALPRRLNQTGRALQYPNQKARLLLQVGLKASQFNVVKLRGAAAKGYEVALVFSCASDLYTGFLPQNDFVILSRTETVPAEVIAEANAFLTGNGILLQGDNALLYTLHNNTRCRPSNAVEFSPSVVAFLANAVQRTRKT